LASSRTVPFLAEVARDDREDLEVRKQAAIAIGINKTPQAVPTLRGLFDSVSNREVREQVIVAAGIHGEESTADDEAVDFLIRVADSERDREVRRQAIFWLSQKAGRRSFDALVDRASGAKGGDVEVQKQAVFALSQRPKDEAVPILMKIAKTHANPEVRKMAIFWLGQIDDDRVLPFFKEILSH
jgi:HEAT repeat protein